MIDYNEAVKIQNNMAMNFFTHPVKDHKRFKLMLFGLSKLVRTCKKLNSKKLSILNWTILKKSPRSNKDDTVYMLEFNIEQITKKEIFKIKY